MTTKTPHVHAGNSASTKVPHPHAELIKQWADGATIEWFNGIEWETTRFPGWAAQHKYRVKPEPKPDIIVYQTLQYIPNKQQVVSYIETKHRCNTDNVMFVFDGETGKLKDCQVLTKE